MDNTRSCQETRNRQWQETLQSMREMGSKNTPADRLSEVAENYRRNGLAVPKQLYEQIQAAYKNQIEEIKSKQELDKLDSKIADQEEAFAKQLIGEVRAELGLPHLE